jgi:hypothetical protein
LTPFIPAVFRSNDAVRLQLEDRAVLRNEQPVGAHLIKPAEHGRTHVGEHDAARAELLEPRLENLPGQVCQVRCPLGCPE